MKNGLNLREILCVKFSTVGSRVALETVFLARKILRIITSGVSEGFLHFASFPNVFFFHLVKLSEENIITLLFT